MSISGLPGVASSGYTTAYSKCSNAPAEPYRDPSTQLDRGAYFEDTFKTAQSQAASLANAKEDGGAGKDKVSVDETPPASLTELGKTRLFSMLLESLFLAELEDSAADSSETANDAKGQGSEECVTRHQSIGTKGGNPLKDGERVAEIKKILTDFTKGKTELSDLPKAMVGVVAGGAGRTAAVASREEGSLTDAATVA